MEIGKARESMDVALCDSKWEGAIAQVCKNGQHFTAHVVITPRCDSSGQPIGYLLILKDILEQIRLTDKLQTTQFYTRSLIESNIDALMTTNPLGMITNVNRQMEAFTGYRRAELIGVPFKQYFTDPSRAESGIRLVLCEERVTDYELTARSKDGRETVVSYNEPHFMTAIRNFKGYLLLLAM